MRILSYHGLQSRHVTHRECASTTYGMNSSSFTGHRSTHPHISIHIIAPVVQGRFEGSRIEGNASFAGRIFRSLARRYRRAWNIPAAWMGSTRIQGGCGRKGQVNPTRTKRHQRQSVWGQEDGTDPIQESQCHIRLKGLLHTVLCRIVIHSMYMFEDMHTGQLALKYIYRWCL
jgi:hypothetical protein